MTVSDRVTEFFAAALGKVISKMYESLGERCVLAFVVLVVEVGGGDGDGGEGSGGRG